MGLALGLVAWTAASAAAQGGFGGVYGIGGGGGFGGFNGYSQQGPRLLFNNSVQKELKLVRDQISKLYSTEREARKKFKDESDKVNKAYQEYFTKQRNLTAKQETERHKEMMALLTKGQARRFKEILLQYLGVRSIQFPEVQKALQLTDDQKKDLRAIDNQVEIDVSKLRAAAFNNKEKMKDLQKNVTEARKKGLDKALAKLSDEQKKTWAKMTGKHFAGLAQVNTTYLYVPYVPTDLNYLDSYMYNYKPFLDELKLSDDVVKKLRAIPTDLYKKYRKDWDGLTKISTANYKKSQEVDRKIYKEFGDLVEGKILKSEQKKRYRQLLVQELGLNAFKDAAVVKKLKLTDDQKKELIDLRKDLEKKVNDALKAAGFDFKKRQEIMTKKIPAWVKETQEKVVAKLSDDQKKTWKDLTGAPFTIKYGFPRPPG
jgi:hypothetical protein